MTKQNVEVNVNMVNVEGVSGVNNSKGTGRMDSTIRISKETHKALLSLKFITGHEVMNDLIKDMFLVYINNLSNEYKLKYDVIKQMNGGDDK